MLLGSIYVDIEHNISEESVYISGESVCISRNEKIFQFLNSMTKNTTELPEAIEHRECGTGLYRPRSALQHCQVTKGIMRL